MLAGGICVCVCVCLPSRSLSVAGNIQTRPDCMTVNGDRHGESRNRNETGSNNSHSHPSISVKSMTCMTWAEISSGRLLVHVSADKPHK